MVKLPPIEVVCGVLPKLDAAPGVSDEAFAPNNPTLLAAGPLFLLLNDAGVDDVPNAILVDDCESPVAPIDA